MRGSPLEIEAERLRRENARLRAALADAICRPMGVIPASAADLVTVGDVTEACARRPPLSGAGMPGMRPLPIIVEADRGE